MIIYLLYNRYIPYLAIYFIFFCCISYKALATSKIYLIMGGSGNQKILNETFYLDPAMVYVNNDPKSSCKKSCEISTSPYKVELNFEDGINSTENMFYGLDNIIEADLSQFDASKVTSMNSMFKDCGNLK